MRRWIPITVVFLLGATTAILFSGPPVANSQAQKVQKIEVGRYQLVLANDHTKKFYILDTATGLIYRSERIEGLFSLRKK